MVIRVMYLGNLKIRYPHGAGARIRRIYQMADAAGTLQADDMRMLGYPAEQQSAASMTDCIEALGATIDG